MLESIIALDKEREAKGLEPTMKMNTFSPNFRWNQISEPEKKFVVKNYLGDLPMYDPLRL